MLKNTAGRNRCSTRHTSATRPCSAVAYASLGGAPPVLVLPSVLGRVGLEFTTGFPSSVCVPARVCVCVCVLVRACLCVSARLRRCLCPCLRLCPRLWRRVCARSHVLVHVFGCLCVPARVGSVWLLCLRALLPWAKRRSPAASSSPSACLPCHPRFVFGRAHGVVVPHPLRMRKALGPNPSVSSALIFSGLGILQGGFGFFWWRIAFHRSAPTANFARYVVPQRLTGVPRALARQQPSSAEPSPRYAI